MMMRRRQLLLLAAQVVPTLVVVSWLATGLVTAGVQRAVAPLLGRLKIVPLDEERIGPADDLAG